MTQPYPGTKIYEISMHYRLSKKNLEDELPKSLFAITRSGTPPSFG